MVLAAVWLASYLIGSLNSAIVVTYLVKHKDIRKFGSFNAGLTNVYRCFGVFTAAMTLLADLLKGVIVIFGTRLALAIPIFESFTLDSLSVCMISALCAVIGHCFPIFYGFKGGKGILVAAVCMLLTDPAVFLLIAILFVILVAATKYISIGSLAACVCYPLFTLVWQYSANALFDAGYENIYLHVLIIFPMFLICYFRHFSNIQHLWSGEEKKFYLHKKGEDE